MSRLTASRAAFDLIASFEGYRTRAVATPSGKWTLGFGHTATAREGLSVTRGEAEDLLRWDLLPIEDSLRQVALTPLTQNQFDALVSFAFNIGLENFKQSDTLKFLNQGQPIAAALSMHAWRRAKVNGRVLTIDALVRRRAAEAALFLEPVGARAAAPTSILTPEVDVAASVLLTPQQIDTPPQNARDKAAEPEQTEVAKPEPEPEPEPVFAQTKPVIRPKILPEAARADVVRQDIAPAQVPAPPVVAPAITIPALPLTEPATPMSSPPAPPKVSPMLPSGIAPFPSGPIYGATTQAANNNADTLSPNIPANDGHNTRLHAAPEMVDVPSSARPAPRKMTIQSEPIDWLGVLPWFGMALGAALLAIGLWIGWKSGLLSVAAPKRDVTGMDLTTLSMAAGGFILLITSAVASITERGSSHDHEDV
jgi:lysozyme